MQSRASFVPTTLVAAVAMAACNISPDPATTDGETTNFTSAGSVDTGSSTGDTGDTNPPTSSEPTTDGPTTQTTQTTPADTTDTADTTDGGDEVTIFQVQNEEFPVDTVVTIKGVVVTSQLKLDDMNKGFVFVEEPEGGPRSGIMLYLYEEVAAAWDAPVGTVIDLTGTYTEFYDNSQLTIMAPGDITVVGPGALPPVASVTSEEIANPDGPLAEDYEGVVVELSDVTVSGTDIGQLVLEGGAIVSDYFLYPDFPFTQKVGDSLASVVGPVLYSFDEYQVAPRTPADLVDDGGGTDTGDTTDTDTDTDSTTGENAATIYDIQQGMFTIGDVVTVEGVVATSGLTFKKDGFFVEDPAGGQYSGIFVYINMLAVNVAPGDVLTITGTYDEFFDNSQIKVTDPALVVKTGTAPLPAPAVVTSATIGSGVEAEKYEGVLVQVNNATVTKVVDNFGEFQVDGALQVNDLFFAKADWVNPALNSKYTSLTGVLEYSFDFYKLSPTKAADIKP